MKQESTPFTFPKRSYWSSYVQFCQVHLSTEMHYLHHSYLNWSFYWRINWIEELFHSSNTLMSDGVKTSGHIHSDSEEFRIAYSLNIYYAFWTVDIALFHSYTTTHIYLYRAAGTTYLPSMPLMITLYQDYPHTNNEDIWPVLLTHLSKP